MLDRADLDIATLRSDTPGCADVVHLNNAGAALPPRPVIDAVVDHLRLEARIGGYEAYDRAIEAVDDFYAAVADLIGGRRDEVAYVENATRAWDLAFHSVPFRPGERILTTTSEYASNAIAYLKVARTHGVRVHVLPDDPHGQLSLAALADELSMGDVGLVSVNHVPTHNGLVNPAAEVGALCRDAGVLYLLDACQSVGQLELDVRELGCDMLSATGRKFLRGPRGTGFLWVRHDVLDRLDEPPFLDLASARWSAQDRYEIRPDARRFETWERYVAGQIGLGVAARYAVSVGMPAVQARVTGLADRLRAELRARPGVTVLDRGEQQSALVTFVVEGRDSAQLAAALRADGINVSTTDGAEQRYDRAAVPAAVRASVHYYTTDDELERLVASVSPRRAG